MKNYNIIINEGIVSRIIGFFACIFFFIFFSVAIVSILPINTFISKMQTTSVICIGNNSFISDKKLEKYNFSNDEKDLPANCQKVVQSQNKLLIFLISLILFAIMYTFFFRFQKIVQENEKLHIYQGNVFIFHHTEIEIDKLNKIIFFEMQKKLFMLPYKIIGIQIVSLGKTFVYSTRIAISKNSNVNVKNIQILKSAFIKCKEDLIVENNIRS